MADRTRGRIGIWAATRQVAASLATLVREVLATVQPAGRREAEPPGRSGRPELQPWPPGEFADQGPPQIWLDYVAAHDPVWFDDRDPSGLAELPEPGIRETERGEAVATIAPGPTSTRLRAAATTTHPPGTERPESTDSGEPAENTAAPPESTLEAPRLPTRRQRPRSRLVRAEPWSEPAAPDPRVGSGPTVARARPAPRASVALASAASRPSSPLEGRSAWQPDVVRRVESPPESNAPPAVASVSPVVGDAAVAASPGRRGSRSEHRQEQIARAPESPVTPHVTGAAVVPPPVRAVASPQRATGRQTPRDPWPPLLQADDTDASIERLSVELVGTVPRLWRQLELGQPDPTIASQRRR